MKKNKKNDNCDICIIYNEINDLKIKQNKIGIKDIITWIIMGLTMIIAIIALFI